MMVKPDASRPRPANQRHGSWYSRDTNYERMALFSPWTIAGFGLAVGLGLLLVYPYRTLEQKLASSELNSKPDRLTVEYLKVFLKAEPNALALRRALVGQLVRLGSYAEAREAMRPLQLASDPAIQRDAEWLELSMLEGEAYALSVSTPAREVAMQRVRAQLRVLVGLPQQDSQRLLVLARTALAAGAVDVAALAYQKIAARPEILAPEIYAEAARAALALGNYRVAANLYFRAMVYTRVIDKRRDYFFAGMRTLQASGDAGDLIASADEHVGMLIDDTATLKFLARLAQSANRLDAAERYAKQLLKLSLLERWQGRQLAGWQSPAQFYAGLDRVDAGPLRFVRIADTSAPGLPFDDDAYTLSYTIFLANRNLNDARRVAESAVLQRPADAGWRKRLAQINQWNTAPEAALPQWLAYARLSGDEAAWDTVLQLGSGLADIDAQVAAIAHKVEREPTSVVWLERLLQVFEASGQPERALALLRTRLSYKSAPALRRRELDLLATLAERTGHDDESLTALRRLQAEFGTDSTVALRIANNLYRANQPGAAFAALERAGAVAPVTDGDFWRAYAELAMLLQNDAAARTGLRSLLAGEVHGDNDLTNLIGLLEAAQPLAAARLAEFAYASKGNPRTALQALNLRARIADWAGARAMLARLTPEQRRLLEQDPAFLSLRASIAQSSNDLDGAARDMRAALALRPAEMELRAALLWILVAKRDTADLKKALSLWAADAENNAVLWDPYAAANMSLNRQDRALHWFRKGGFRNDDYLWLMSYAEVLDAVSQKEQAWRIRRHVWLDLRNPDVLRKANPEQLGALRDRLVAVAPLFMNGDGADRVMRALLRADISTLVAFVPPQAPPRTGREMLARLDQPDTAQLPLLQQRDKQRAAQRSSAPMDALLAPAPAAGRPQDDVRLTATARELALAYALNRNANDLAAAWFASRFAAQLEKPLWGELSLLLASEDRAQLNRLLDDVPDWLPMYDRIEAAQRAGRPGLAQTMAFDQLALLPTDEDLHLRLTTMTTEQPAGFSATVNQMTVSPLSARETELQTSVYLTPGLRLTVALIDRQYRSLDDTALVNLPGSDRQLELSLRKQLDGGYVSATVQQRQGAGSNTGLRLDYSLTLSPPVSVAGSVGVRQLATESALLRVAAMRDGVESTVTYALSRAEYLRLGLAWHRYASQAGNVLGSGGNWNVEAGTHLRLEYPNITLRAFASGSAYRDRNQIDALVGNLLPAGTDLTQIRALPVNERLVGISLGLGTVIDTRYTRAWRPFAELGLTRSDVTGSGVNLRAGIAGSVLGQDLMTLRGLRSSSSAASPQGSQEIGLDYKWFF
ncbi:tetratricopeptide repeat protein [Actimicrobium sp. CCC2.4]|uniref:tetratricopeptide repeat protein n=1 Tax=Actimicrobium sp. CCC2.4 TaxID=3048606 RepID=UPI002AC9B51F|nr:tetratricopeptide repeat protein [Actimicrobium sp. CCC2.4]MEB0134080.1 tetratricopeptide repeat protein [Actimicrobium sp. CCC2.4]WPX31612.1 tetratricopeptide repeat protein [Actimicrobium sp. CCC2.4]